MHGDDVINCVATDQQSYDIWADGIRGWMGKLVAECALLHFTSSSPGKPLVSEMCELESEELADLNLRVQTVELDGVDLPLDAPIAPPPPPNFDFVNP